MKFILENYKNICSIISITLISVNIIVFFIGYRFFKHEQSRIEYIAEYDLTEFHKQYDKLDHKKKVFKNVVMGIAYLASFFVMVTGAIITLQMPRS